MSKRPQSAPSVDSKSRKDQQAAVLVNVASCKYSVVREAVAKLNWSLIDDQEDATPCNLRWLDVGVGVDKVMAMPFGKINHFPGMECLHKKTGLAATLRPLQRACPRSYEGVHPATWLLPEEMADFVRAMAPDETQADTSARVAKKCFIIKPAASCQGRGIHLVRCIEDLQDPRAASIAQQYESRPFLVEGLKFDLRIYVMLESVDPLRAFLYDEGLVRFATVPYSEPSASNIKLVRQHLTNYAVNKDSVHFVQNSGGVTRGNVGSKRTLSWFRSWLDSQGFSSTVVWGRIVDLIIKVLIAGQPHLARTYRSAVPADGGSLRCFELLGLDVLLNRDLNPVLLEVNHSPSLSCDSQLDSQIKSALLEETLKLLRLRSGDSRRAQEAAAAAAKRRLYGGATSAAAGGAGQGGGDGVVTASSTALQQQGASKKKALAGGVFRGLVEEALSSATARPAVASPASSPAGSHSRLVLPPHVLATAPQFASLAAAIPEDHVSPLSHQSLLQTRAPSITCRQNLPHNPSYRPSTRQERVEASPSFFLRVIQPLWPTQFLLVAPPQLKR